MSGKGQHELQPTVLEALGVLEQTADTAGVEISINPTDRKGRLIIKRNHLPKSHK